MDTEAGRSRGGEAQGYRGAVERPGCTSPPSSSRRRRRPYRGDPDGDADAGARAVGARRTRPRVQIGGWRPRPHVPSTRCVGRAGPTGPTDRKAGPLSPRRERVGLSLKELADGIARRARALPCRRTGLSRERAVPVRASRLSAARVAHLYTHTGPRPGPGEGPGRRRHCQPPRPGQTQTCSTAPTVQRTTLSGGSLGSHVDEERSQLRYAM